MPEALRKPFEIPLPDGDDWPVDPIVVFRTRPDVSTDPADEGKPTAYRNIETHWWDASQVYGSSDGRGWQKSAATPPPARLRRTARSISTTMGHLPLTGAEGDSKQQGKVELAGVNGNWWIGLSLMHTLFAREHNVICDRLKLEYPRADGEWLFNKARLIVAALTAKIHTVEWTPALLNTPTMRTAMRANWWGLLGERFIRGYGRKVDSEVLGGIIGGEPDHHGAPYAMTEEFTAVYRMHALMPDVFHFRRHGRRRRDRHAVADRGVGRGRAETLRNGPAGRRRL